MSDQYRSIPSKLYTHTYLREMELQWIVCAKTNIEPSLEEIWKGIPLIREEQSIIAQWTHCNSDLFEIEEILQCGDFTQKDPVGY